MTKKAKGTTTRKPQTPEVSPVNVASTAAMPEGFKAKRVVTLPSLAIKNAGEAHTLLIQDAMRVSQVQNKPDATGKPQTPATICTAVDLGSGQQLIFIVPAVVKSNLERDYPDEGYVGKSFYVKNMGKRKTGQRYHDFEIIEVERE